MHMHMHMGSSVAYLVRRGFLLQLLVGLEQSALRVRSA